MRKSSLGHSYLGQIHVAYATLIINADMGFFSQVYGVGVSSRLCLTLSVKRGTIISWSWVVVAYREHWVGRGDYRHPERVL